MPSSSSACGDALSMRMIDLPTLLCPVTMRRIGLAIRSSSPGMIECHAVAAAAMLVQPDRTVPQKRASPPGPRQSCRIGDARDNTFSTRMPRGESARGGHMRLSGKVALVTGAQQGIGRAIAVALAREGADGVAGEVRRLGRRAVVTRGDVAQAAEVEAMVGAVVGALGPPDVLVNNAGVFPRARFLEMTERDWDHVLGVNLKGGFLCAQTVARAMVAADRPGAIVNISSSAIRGDPLGVHYSASKAGVVGLTRAMALALAPHRIRVNAIAPVLTDTQQPRYGNTEEQLAIRAREIPLGRMAQPEEIAAVAVFLATADAVWITGELIHVNGGAYMA